jgi:hypothetical protein
MYGNDEIDEDEDDEVEFPDLAQATLVPSTTTRLPTPTAPAPQQDLAPPPPRSEADIVQVRTVPPPVNYLSGIVAGLAMIGSSMWLGNRFQAPG